MENVNLNFGALQPLLADDSISEVMVNRLDSIFVEKEGKLVKTNIHFPSEKSLQDLIQQIASFNSRTINAERPYMDGHLPDGSRINAVLPPMAPSGASLTIRKFRKAAFTLQDYIHMGAITDKSAFFLHACVMARVNLVVSGGTGTGKTTFLNTLSSLIPHNQRIVTIEDVAEINLTHPNWVRLESVFQGKGGVVTTRECLMNALRMRPDRIIVGECRRDETFEMLQAMNTGHDGSMTTVHANSPRDCLSRIESLVVTANVDMPLTALRQQMASAIDVIIQLKRTKNGQRIVHDIIELTGMEQGTVTSQSLFSRDKKTDSLQATGLVPSFMERFTETGVQFPPNFFDVNTQVTYRPD